MDSAGLEAGMRETRPLIDRVGSLEEAIREIRVELERLRPKVVVKKFFSKAHKLKLSEAMKRRHAEKKQAGKAWRDAERKAEGNEGGSEGGVS